MSPPFTPPKGRKDKKARAGFAVYVVIDAYLAIWERTVCKEAMSSYPTCFISSFHA
jgi:hypothetical protein